MAIVFTEGKKLPDEVRGMGHYRGFGANMNTETAVADIFKSLTTGAVDFFGGSSSAAKEAAANAAYMQAQAYGTQQAEAASTKRLVIIAAAGLVGVVILASALRRPSQTAGYRRSRRKRSRR